MEKFSEFRDPVTGINPFLMPKTKKFTLSTLLRAILSAPLYFLYILGLPVVHHLFRIKVRGSSRPRGRVHANSVTEFDRRIIERVYGPCSVSFPEGATTNNRGILHYERTGCESVVGLCYSPECVYLYGSRLHWLFNFLGGDRVVEVCCMEGGDLGKATGLPCLKIGRQEKERFLSKIKE